MTSAVIILPLALREHGNALGEALGYGPDSYTIPLVASGSPTATHIGLRADVGNEFIELVQNAKLGIYPTEIPIDLVSLVIGAIISDFSDELWGYDHATKVFEDNNFTILY